MTREFDVGAEIKRTAFAFNAAADLFGHGLDQLRRRSDVLGKGSDMSESLVEIGPCLRQAIDLMEQLYESASGSCGIRCPSWREFGPWLAEGVKKLEEELAALEYLFMDGPDRKAMEVSRSNRARRPGTEQ